MRIGGMLESFGIALIVLWLSAIISGHTFGNYVYLLLVVAVALLLVRLLSARPRS